MVRRNFGFAFWFLLIMGCGLGTATTVQVVPSGHGVHNDEEGRAAIVQELDENCICRHPSCGVP